MSDRQEDIRLVAHHLAGVAFPEDRGGPLSLRVNNVADALEANRGADIAELLDAAERYWRLRENDKAATRVRIADALRQAADFARHKGDDDLASRILRLLFEDP